MTVSLERQIIYPDSDGQPMADNTKQFRWIVLLKENLECLFAQNPEVFVAGDLLWYPVEGKPEMLLSQVAEKVKAIENQRQKSNIAACVELLTGINYSEDLIKMYLHDDILKESVTYQRILNEGVTKGVGLGEKSEAIALISRQLKKRFGDISETIKHRLHTLSIRNFRILS